MELKFINPNGEITQYDSPDDEIHFNHINILKEEIEKTIDTTVNKFEIPKVKFDLMTSKYKEELAHNVCFNLSKMYLSKLENKKYIFRYLVTTYLHNVMTSYALEESDQEMLESFEKDVGKVFVDKFMRKLDEPKS